MKKFLEIIKKHSEIFVIIALAIIFYTIFIHNIGTYSLMDVDETRYVSIARDMIFNQDYLTLLLNENFFFEKPPLYFWHECLSFYLWGVINEFTARFGVAILGFILSFAVYFSSKKVVNRNFGIISSLILATSLEFVILAKYAILDIVLAFYTGLALIVYFQTFFCKESNKKYFWWAFYLFSGLAVMAKGIPGIAIPFGTVFFASIITKRFKETFKPIYLIPGTVLFLLVVVPWHYIMLKQYDPLFFNEYIIKHHLHRFLNTANNEIGRKQPFYYYILAILWGFIPWIFSAISVLILKIKDLKKLYLFEKIKNFNFENHSNIEKYVILNWIAFGWIFLFFSASSTKLVTYILPVYLPLAVIGAKLWYEFITEKKYEKPVNVSVYTAGTIFFIAGIAAIVVFPFLPEQLRLDISDVKWFCAIVFLIYGAGSIYFAKNKKAVEIFLLNVLFIAIISGFGTGKFFEVDYNFGQNDLVEFAKLAREKNYRISCYEMARKYSLLYYRNDKINYNEGIDINPESVAKDLETPKTVVIIKNKKMNIIEGKVNFDTIKQGRRYSLIKGK